MNAFLKKEVRLLLPSVVIGLMLTASFWIVPWGRDEPGWWLPFLAVPFFAFPAVVVMMSLDSFGRELSAGTFSVLLSQPISRARIWWTKTSLLALAILLLCAAWWISARGSFLLHGRTEGLPDLGTTAVLFAISVFSGGLWTVLLFRLVAAAFWMALVVPAAIAMGVLHFSGPEIEGIRRSMILALSVYSIAGFAFAWWLFQRAQDVSWTGGVIRLPSIRLALPAWTGRIFGKHRPGRALLWKEIGLHQSHLLIAVLLAALHLAVLGLRNMEGTFASAPINRTVFEIFWGLWLLMPLLIGSAAVAEERKLGTMEGQLCLPVKKRTQFLIKATVAIIATLLFGMVAPLIFEGSRILPAFGPDPDEGSLSWMVSREIGSGAYSVLKFTGIALLIGGMGFYASTLTRGTLQAIAPAVLGIVLALLLWIVIDGWTLLGFTNLWGRSPLIYLMGVPVMALTLAILSYVNFQASPGTPSLVRKNLIVLALALVFVVATTTAVYQRSWELLQTSEPGHGPARLSLSERPILQGAYPHVMVQHTDGRVWINWMPEFGRMHREEGFWLEGSNWVAAAATQGHVAGLQRDGTLWVSNPTGWIWHGSVEDVEGGTSTVQMQKVSDDRDWKGLASSPLTFILLKADGSLWELGPEVFMRAARVPAPLSLETPVPLQAGSDWTDMGSVLGRAIYLRNRAGEIYRSSGISPRPDSVSIAGIQFSRVPASVPPSAVPQFVHGGGKVQTVIVDSGRFRVVGQWAWQNGWIWEDADISLGNEANWVEAAVFDSSRAVTLKSDGTLWLWDLWYDPVQNPDAVARRQLSRHSDWVAVGPAVDEGFLALAADGSLWKWDFPAPYGGSDALTRPSRRPQKVASMVLP